MDKELIAIRDGKYDEAIKLAKKHLEESPDEINSHFTLAQAYDAKGASKEALEHVERCLKVLPDFFEALYLAAISAKGIKKYDEAYQYAIKALKDGQDPNLPKVVRILLKVLSYIPGLNALRNTNKSVVGSYAKKTQWLHEYVVWYEQQSPNPTFKRDA